MYTNTKYMQKETRLFHQHCKELVQPCCVVWTSIWQVTSCQINQFWVNTHVSELVFCGLGNSFQVEQSKILRSNTFLNGEKCFWKLLRCCNMLMGANVWATSNVIISKQVEHPPKTKDDPKTLVVSSKKLASVKLVYNILTQNYKYLVFPQNLCHISWQMNKSCRVWYLII